MECLPVNLQERFNNKNIAVSESSKISLEKLKFLKRFTQIFLLPRTDRRKGPLDVSNDENYSEELKKELHKILNSISIKLDFQWDDILKDINFRGKFSFQVATVIIHYLKGHYRTFSELHEENLIEVRFGLSRQQEADNIITSFENEGSRKKEEEEESKSLFPLKLLSIDGNGIISK